MAYSAVTHPLPWPLKKGGTRLSILALQITFVSPTWIKTDPSGCLIKSVVIVKDRKSFTFRLSILIFIRLLITSISLSYFHPKKNEYSTCINIRWNHRLHSCDFDYIFYIFFTTMKFFTVIVYIF